MVESNQNVARFEVSGITVPLPERWYFHDEGASSLDCLFPLSEGPRSITGRAFEIVVGHLTRYLTNVEGMEIGKARNEARKHALYENGFHTLLVNVASGLSYISGASLLHGPNNYGNGDETHIHILYLDVGREDFNLRIRAHEEQHVISYIPGGLQILERKIEEECGEKVYFDKITDREVAADLNAVHALTVRGFDLKEIIKSDSGLDPNLGRKFRRAMHIYETGDYGNL